MALSSRILAPGSLGVSNPTTTGRIPAAKGLVSRGATLPLEQTGSRALDQMQKNVSKALDGIKSLPFGNGNLVEGQQFANGGNTVVTHSLKGTPRGFLILNARACSSGTPCASLAGVSSGSLVLQSFGTFTADVWCYF